MSVQINAAELAKLKNEHKEFKRDAAVLRSVIATAELGAAVVAGTAGVVGDFGALGSTTDSLIRAGALIGATAATLDAGSRYNSVIKMYND